MKTTFTAEEAERQFRDVMKTASLGEPVTIVMDSKRYVLREEDWVAPPGYFENSYTPEEIEESNMLAKHSVIAVPHDLE